MKIVRNDAERKLTVGDLKAGDFFEVVSHNSKADLSDSGKVCMLAQDVADLNYPDVVVFEENKPAYDASFHRGWIVRKLDVDLHVNGEIK